MGNQIHEDIKAVGDKLGSFHMGIRELDPQQAQSVDLGPLRQLQGTWVGKPNNGWNVISVPGPKAADAGFVLEVIPYREVLTFTPVVVAANRGPFDASGTEQVQEIAGLLYNQAIFSTCDTANCATRGFASGQQIHAERGIFLFLQNEATATQNVVRLATIPHGNALLALGQSFHSVAPPPIVNFIQPNSILPTPNYGAAIFNAQQFPGVFDQLNPNSFLIKTLGSDKILEMTTLVLNTDPAPGGILNIPFLANVTAKSFNCIFWIERIEGDREGRHDFMQLQYTQTINLVFPPTGGAAPITWPHVTINTLHRQQAHL